MVLKPARPGLSPPDIVIDPGSTVHKLTRSALTGAAAQVITTAIEAWHIIAARENRP